MAAPKEKIIINIYIYIYISEYDKIWAYHNIKKAATFNKQEKTEKMKVHHSMPRQLQTVNNAGHLKM